ncbi:AsmA-like C-terminal region-containing protein [Cytophagales bacterium LB-30]|uniref:AsmA-like C-terminal region-containing protein n=1 Tax=Shiella aurantiaca TaxID=3058365 RepID=A0ABT8F6W2_9BACT|nr:AsmA-like C-terminal region-containing protein [Shiella aurantiaca]MDN4166195.1 AsmA-like C-terminal region-containing protein [Shiella aurantiaca]
MLTLLALGYFYQDRLIQWFLAEANERINTPITVERIDFSLIEDFPKASFTFNNFSIQEAIEGSSLPLARGQKLSLAFNVWDLYQGNYQIQKVALENAEVTVRITKTGLPNYLFLKKRESLEPDTTMLQLQSISLHEVTINYIDEKLKQSYQVQARQIGAQLQVADEQVLVFLKGSAHSKYIKVGEDVYFQDKALAIESSFSYSLKNQYLELMPSTLTVWQTKMQINGAFQFLEKETKINLSAQTDHTDVYTLLQVIPSRYTKSLRAFKTEGIINFSSTIKGSYSDYKNPWVEVKFATNEASFYHPDYQKRMNNIRFSGYYTNGERMSARTSLFKVENLSAELEDKKIEASFILSNFDDFHLDGQFSGEIDAASLMAFYKPEAIESAKGLVNFQIGIKGRLNDLKSKTTSRQVATSGELSISNLSLQLNTYPLAMSQFNGNFLFNNNDLAISDFSGKVGSSDFLLNGFFKNITAYLLFDNEPIGIEADLESHLLNVDELLSVNAGTNSESNYALSLSPLLQIVFNCKVDQVRFKRFHGENLRGKLLLKDQVAQLKGITLQAAGGRVSLESTLDQRASDHHLSLDVDGRLESMEVDSIFYVFENFNQTWIEDRHLKGQISASAQVHIDFDSLMRYQTESITALIDAVVKNGELNNFEPMQELAGYVEEENLNHLVFSELKNEISIKNQTVYLPEMTISSNVTSLQISGTHTFDQKIDYSVVVPIRASKRYDKDEAFGAIEDDGTGVPKLFLTIKGTTDDYKIAYDTKRVRKKIKEDIKKEGQELKDLFKKKNEKEADKTQELNEEEYFEFD